ncbi:MAG TPA: hypothetical protein VGS19_10055 [Streptosporangiaceae bacterium]|nr:hypothetical protein [Streptosporangiaceae bacterium]
MELPSIADQLDLAPELRLASYTFREEFGHAPMGVWQAPGMVTLLADGAERLRVAAPWGSIVAAEPRSDGMVEPRHVNRPGERMPLSVEEAAAGLGPQWGRDGLRAARTGATLLAATDLPDGSGIGATAATQTAIALALRDLAEDGAGGLSCPAGDELSGFPAGTARLGGQQFPCDLAAAGLRLMVIDTRVRGVPRPAVPEVAPLDRAADVLATGDLAALGPLLTSAHAAAMCHEAQEAAVSAAVRAGALGARMIVDGPGRPVCALVPTARLAQVRAEVVAEFDRRQRRAPRFLTFTPTAGPRRAA